MAFLLPSEARRGLFEDMQFDSRRVTIMGLGHFGGGVAAARWLARQGAVVTITDLADKHVLADSLAALDGVPVAAMHLTGHREEDFRTADWVVVNPAAPPGNRFVQLARDSGARLTSEVELFLRGSRARIIGVTGSNGKSTTAAMIQRIIESDGRRAWLGGNIGRSLLGDLDRIGPDDWVVLELSSFQLWYSSPDVRMPQMAVVTNCSPNHLDWHGTYEHYVAAKQRILVNQTADDLAVLGPADPEVGSWEPVVRGRRLPPVCDDLIPPLLVPGEHNRCNAVCAATAAAGVGCSREAIRRGLRTFSALPGRLDPLGQIAGRRFYDDSAATTPEGTIAALEASQRPLWLLAGGSDKGLGFDKLAAAIGRSASGAAFYGATGRLLRDRVAASAPDFPSAVVETMARALDWCWRRSRPGDCIVLSPACASHDQFQNFQSRGAKFRELVRALKDRHGR